MHCVCLGIAQNCAGNIVWVCFRHMKGTRSAWVRPCGRLKNMAKLAARILGVRLPFNQLTLNMFNVDACSKPKLKLKAADTRDFLPILQFMLATFPQRRRLGFTIILPEPPLRHVHRDQELGSWRKHSSIVVFVPQALGAAFSAQCKSHRRAIMGIIPQAPFNGAYMRAFVLEPEIGVELFGGICDRRCR